MKWLIIALLAVTLAVSSCNILSNSNGGLSFDASIAKVTGMSAIQRMIGGPSLAIEITPTKQVKAGYYYIVSIEEKGLGGRLRTYITWSQAEVNVLKPRTIYMPLTQNELAAYKNEESKLSNIFKVTIASKPFNKAEIKETER